MLTTADEVAKFSHNLRAELQKMIKDHKSRSLTHRDNKRRFENFIRAKRNELSHSAQNELANITLLCDAVSTKSSKAHGYFTRKYNNTQRDRSGNQKEAVFMQRWNTFERQNDLDNARSHMDVYRKICDGMLYLEEQEKETAAELGVR